LTERGKKEKKKVQAVVRKKRKKASSRSRIADLGFERGCLREAAERGEKRGEQEKGGGELGEKGGTVERKKSEGSKDVRSEVWRSIRVANAFTKKLGPCRGGGEGEAQWGRRGRGGSLGTREQISSTCSRHSECQGGMIREEKS